MHIVKEMITKKDRYTILISSQYAKTVYKVSIGSPLLILTFLCILASIGSFFLIVYSYMGIRYTQEEYLTLKNENELLREQKKLFESEYNTINDRVAKINNVQEDIRSREGLDPEKESLSGIGGFAPDETPETGELATRHHLLTNEMSRELDKLKIECSLREKSLQELLVFFEGQTDYLNSTPSIWPARGFIGSAFGFRRDPFNYTITMHNGLDIDNKIGTPVHASADGIVIYAGFETGYGRLIIIDHGYGFNTRYGHLNAITVKEGQRVKKGDRIGEIGCSGRCTGPHVHYEVRINNVPMNPLTYLPN